MKIKAKPTSWNKIESGLLCVFLSEDGWEKEALKYQSAVGADIIKLLKAEKFTGKFGSLEILPTFGRIPSSYILFLGLGKNSEFDLNKLRLLAAKIGKLAKTKHKATVAIDLNPDLFKDNFAETAQSVSVGLILGAYEFSKYKSKKADEDNVDTEAAILIPAGKLQHGANGLLQGQISAAATVIARDLVNESPTVTTPTYLALVAKNLSRKDGIQVEILEEKDCRKLGMNAYLSVSRGSSEPPKFICLTYKGGGRKKIAVIGKTITFDTGGLSLKDAKNMETMKLDMAGGAAVLGLFSILSQLKPKATIYGILPATENMPGSRAIKPGDVVRAANGKSIEILNTDAEGRMTLADGLDFAEKLKPDYMIDLATLTGACLVALGEDIAGLFGSSEELLNKVKQAAKSAGEEVWQLPLHEDYKADMEGTISDLRNVSKTRSGGAITGALFLREFIDKTPWAHLDIAGPAWEEKGTDLTSQGGTGFGVRLLIELIKGLA